jgi:hypothetical protein
MNRADALARRSETSPAVTLETNPARKVQIAPVGRESHPEAPPRITSLVPKMPAAIPVLEPGAGGSA